MSTEPMPKAYEPKAVEDTLYEAWERSGFFNPDKLPDAKNRKPFVIMLPPPNATGTLHLGHAVMLALEDLMIRFERMRGKATLWIPGTDHAAIATQNKVEKLILEQEKKTRHDLGREEFLRRVEAFVKSSQTTIRNQVRKMGSSCDWSREAYTLDETRSEAVREMFVRMHADGLMYRGERIVNWCPRDASTLADDEVVYKEEKVPFYYFKYGPITIGTARPETKFLDKTIVVHPGDARYQHLIGKTFDVEWIEGTVKANVVADPEMDMEFGTGAMTITPAHDFHDFELAKQHGLPVVKIIDEMGNFTAAVGAFAGKNARASRAEIIELLQKKGLVERIDENYIHNVSVCYRCETPIEPLPSLQWFIDVNKEIPGRKKSLKELSLEAVKSGATEIIPDRFTKIYFHWMENLRDWCVSRQIWFGHRIPAWYCVHGHVSVARETPKKCHGCDMTDLTQDPDTFDTWFSSGTWTFSTLGWPKDTSDLKRFHPTQVLETGYDILFFWIARMILMTTYAMKEVPFEKVYLHGLVRDEQGRKMSKSLDNIIDPLDVAEKYGTDAVRLALILGSTPGQDKKLSETKIADFRNFTNKLWNISRFVQMQAGGLRLVENVEGKTLADRWVLGRLSEVTQKTTDLLAAYDFSLAGELLREFTWGEFADWYLEIAKIEGNKSDLLCYMLERVLALWHPFMPFVTEEIYKQFDRGFLMIRDWPTPEYTLVQEDLGTFSDLQAVVTALRNLRSEYKVEPGKLVNANIAGAEGLRDQDHVIRSLARLSSLTFVSSTPSEPGATAVVGITTVHVPLAGLVDPEKERARLIDEAQQAAAQIERLTAQLANAEFLSKAPPAVIEKMRATLAEAQERQKALMQQLSQL